MLQHCHGHSVRHLISITVLQTPPVSATKDRVLLQNLNFFLYCSFCTAIFQRCLTCVHQGSMDPPYISLEPLNLLGYMAWGQISSQCSLDLLLSLPFALAPLEIVRFLSCPTTYLKNSYCSISSPVFHIPNTVAPNSKWVTENTLFFFNWWNMQDATRLSFCRVYSNLPQIIELLNTSLNIIKQVLGVVSYRT